MPEKICPYCEESFDANSLETESCRKTKCVKANQRKKKREASGVTEVRRGRPKSHVAALKQKVIERIKSKSGKAEGPSSTIRAGSDLPVPDVPRSGVRTSFKTFPPVEAGSEILNHEFASLPITGTKLGADFNEEAARLKANLREAGLLERFKNPPIEDYFPKQGPFPHGMGNTFTPHPVENHGTTNDLARQTILSRVPVVREDPNSDAALLKRLQSVKTAKGKEEA